MSNRLITWGPVVMYMNLIFYLSAQSSLPGPSHPFPLYDKLVHATLFGGLSLFFFRAWKKEHVYFPVALAIICTTLYGISDEIHQAFVPGRHMELWDAVADAMGSLVILFWRK